MQEKIHMLANDDDDDDDDIRLIINYDVTCQLNTQLKYSI